MNEFELISQLTRGLPTNDAVVIGAGDDCAVLECGAADRQLLFKTDAVVEGIHFTPDTPPAKIGHKALARCLSDIAAMAGTPTAALVTIGLPKKFNPARVEKIYTGLNELARRHAVAVVGGETTTSPERVFIAISLMGFVPRGRALLRSSAKVGDAIFVTGELGGSLAGKHLDFEPRLAEARWLAGHFAIHALMDVSDGLAGDLRHILKASGVGAELLKKALPVSREAKELSRRGRREEAESSGLPGGPPLHVGGGKPAFVAALTDGEDFELLFTLAGKHAVALLDEWRKEFPKLKLSCIGKITAGSALTIRDEQGVRAFRGHGYDHFA